MNQQQYIMRKVIPLLALTLLISMPISAQILKVNKGFAVEDSSRYFSGHAALNLSLNNRNSTAKEQVHFTLLKFTGDMGYTSDEHVYYLIGDARYFQSTGGPLLSTGYAHARSNLLRKRILSYELFAQAQYDQGRNLDARLLGGGGIRVRLLQKLAFGLGVMQEQEAWERISDETTVSKDITKLTSYLTGKFDLSPITKLSVTSYYQTGIDLEDDIWRHRISLDAALNFSIAKKLSFSAGYGMTYEDRPIIEISKYVFSLSNGIKYTF